MFASRDPVLYWAGDENLYRYVCNNSVIYVDPTGLATRKVTGTLGPQGMYALFYDTWTAIQASATARRITALHILVISQDFLKQHATDYPDSVLTKRLMLPALRSVRS